jgi:hypothetical protein
VVIYLAFVIALGVVGLLPKRPEGCEADDEL